MHRVLFVGEQGDSPSAYYRCHLPAKGLAALGWNADEAFVLYEEESHKLRGWHNGERLPLPHSIVVRHMVGPEGELWSSADMFKGARDQGQQVFMDMDDDPWHLPANNPAAKWIDNTVLDLVAGNMHEATGIIVSTPAIASVVQEHTDTPVTVLANSIDTDAYRNIPIVPSDDWVLPAMHPPSTTTTPIRLGWVGLTSFRADDLRSIVPALHEALEGQWGKVEFWQLGAHPAQSEDVFDILDGYKFPVRIVSRPWVAIRDLPSSLAQIDVAIIPQVPSKFADARSDITGLALCAAGIPFVATSTPEYDKLWTLGAGYTAKSHDSWVQGIRMLIDPVYETARTDLRTGGLSVANFRSPVNIARKYAELFTNVNVDA